MTPDSLALRFHRAIGRRARDRGFSLIELAVVLIVIGVIAAIAIPTFQTVIDRAGVRAAVAEQESIGREVIALMAFGDDPYDALDATLGDVDASAPGVWAAQKYTLHPTMATGESDAGTVTAEDPQGLVSWAVNIENSAIGWAVVHNNDVSVLCRAEGSTSGCWSVADRANGADALEGAPASPGGDPGDGPEEPLPPELFAIGSTGTSSGSVNPTSTAVTSDGGTAVAGYFSGNIDFGAPGAGFMSSNTNRIFVSKFDSSGEWLWNAQGVSSSAGEARSMTATSDGGAIVAGKFSGTTTFGSVELVASGVADAFVGKIDSSGNWVWAAAASGGNGTNEANGVTVTSDGGAIVTGSIFGSNIAFGSTTVSSAPTNAADVFVAKVNASGNWEWVTTGGSSRTDAGLAADSTPDGGAVIAGSFRGETATFGSITLTSPNTNNNDLFVAKVDASGTWVWVSQAGGTGIDHGAAIVAVGDGAVVAGYFRNSPTFGETTLTSSGNDDLFVAKVNSAGVWQWANSAGGTSVDRATGLAATSDGGVILTGYFTGTVSFGSHELASTSGSAALLAKVSTTGNWDWAERVESAGASQGLDVALDSAGGIRLAGTYRTSATFGESTLTTSNSPGGFIASATATGSFG